MNAVVILEGIADLIVKVLLLIIFLPKTLYKIISDPRWVPNYIREKVAKKGTYSDYVSPIFLYILTGLAPYLFVPVEVLSEFTDGNDGSITKMVQDPDTLIRAATFFCIPLLFAFSTELFRSADFSRKSIERNLLVQCYYFAPLVLVVQIRWVFEYKSYSLAGYDMELLIMPLLMLIGFWLLAVEIKYLLKELRQSKRKVALVLALSTLLIFAATDSIGIKVAERFGISGVSLERADALILLLVTTVLYIMAFAKLFLDWRKRKKAEQGKPVSTPSEQD